MFHKLAVKALPVGHRWEHYFMVACASCEAAGLHALIWYLSLGLVITGALGIAYEASREAAQ